MPYTKFRVIDQQPPKDHPTSNPDEWAFLEAQDNPNAGAQVPQDSGTEGTQNRTCTLDLSAHPLDGKHELEGDATATVYVEHADANQAPAGSYTRYDLTLPSSPPEATTLILELTGRGTQASAQLMTQVEGQAAVPLEGGGLATESNQPKPPWA